MRRPPQRVANSNQMLENFRTLMCRGDHPVQVSEKVEELYNELAKHVHAKDDTEVRRVFRELLDTGRSRQEIVSEVVRLVEGKSNSGAGATRSTDQKRSASSRRSSPPGQTERRQKRSTGSDTPATNDAEQQPVGVRAEKAPHRLETALKFQRDQRASETSGTGLTQVEESSPAQIIERERESSPEIEEQGAELTEIMSTPDTGSALAVSITAEPEAAAVPAEAESALCELERKVAVGREVRSDNFEDRQETTFINTTSDQVDIKHENTPLSVPERLAAKLQLEEVPEAEGTRTVQKQADAPSTDWSRLPQRGWRPSPRTLGRRTGVSVLAAAAGGLYVLCGPYASQIEEVSLSTARSAVTWFQYVRTRGLSQNPGRAITVENTVPGEAMADRSYQPAKLRQDVGEARTLRPTAEPANVVTRSAPVAGTGHPAADTTPTRSEPNTEATSTQPGAELPNSTLPRAEVRPTPPSREGPVSSGTPTSSVLVTKTETGQSPTASAAKSEDLSIDTGALVARGDQLLAASDIASARLFYQRAAEAGDGQGALRMGMTFDPAFLADSGLRGVRGDPAQAVSWYRRAIALGNSAAPREVQGLDQPAEPVPQSVQAAPIGGFDQPGHQASKRRRAGHPPPKPEHRASHN